MTLQYNPEQEGGSVVRFEVMVGPIGSDCERQLTNEELVKLRKLLVGTGEDSTVDRIFLSQFAGFMAFEVLKEDLIDLEDIESEMRIAGEAGASYALGFREYASAKEWPEDVSPPGFVYEMMEKWFEYLKENDQFSYVNEYFGFEEVKIG